MNDAEIIKLLAFRTDYKEGSSGEITEDDLLSLASVGLQMSFLNEIEGTLRNVLNLDEFRISRDSLSDSAKNALIQMMEMCIVFKLENICQIRLCFVIQKA